MTTVLFNGRQNQFKKTEGSSNIEVIRNDREFSRNKEFWFDYRRGTLDGLNWDSGGAQILQDNALIVFDDPNFYDVLMSIESSVVPLSTLVSQGHVNFCIGFEFNVRYSTNPDGDKLYEINSFKGIPPNEIIVKFFIKKEGEDLIFGLNQTNGLNTVNLFDYITIKENIGVQQFKIYGYTGFIYNSTTQQNVCYVYCISPELGINNYYYLNLRNSAHLVAEFPTETFATFSPTQIYFGAGWSETAIVTGKIKSVSYNDTLYLSYMNGIYSIPYGNQISRNDGYSRFVTRKESEKIFSDLNRMVSYYSNSSDGIFTYSSIVPHDNTLQYSKNSLEINICNPQGEMIIEELTDRGRGRISYIDILSEKSVGDCSVFFDKSYCENISNRDPYDRDELKIMCVKSGKLNEESGRSLYECPEFSPYDIENRKSSYRWTFEDPMFVDWLRYSSSPASTTGLVRNSKFFYDEETKRIFLLTLETEDEDFDANDLKLYSYDATEPFTDPTLQTPITIASQLDSYRPQNIFMTTNSKPDPSYSMWMCFGKYMNIYDEDLNREVRTRKIYVFWISHADPDNRSRIMYKYSEDECDSWSSICYIDLSEMSGRLNLSYVMDFGIDCVGGKFVIAPSYSENAQKYSEIPGIYFQDVFHISEPFKSENIFLSKRSRVFPYNDFGPFDPTLSSNPRFVKPKVWADKLRNTFILSFVNARNGSTAFVYTSPNGSLWYPFYMPDGRPEYFRNGLDFSFERNDFSTFDISFGTMVDDLSVVMDGNGYIHIVYEQSRSKNLFYEKISPAQIALISRWSSTRMEAAYVDENDIDISEDDIGLMVPTEYNAIPYWELRYRNVDEFNQGIETQRLFNSMANSLIVEMGGDEITYGNMAPNICLMSSKMFLTFFTGIFSKDDPEIGDGATAIDRCYSYFSISMNEYRKGSRYSWVYGANTTNLFRYSNSPEFSGFSTSGDVSASAGSTRIVPASIIGNHFMKMNTAAFTNIEYLSENSFEKIDGNIVNDGVKFYCSFVPVGSGFTSGNKFLIKIISNNSSGGLGIYGFVSVDCIIDIGANTMRIKDNIGSYDETFTLTYSPFAIGFVNILEFYLRKNNNDSSEPEEDVEIYVVKRTKKIGNYLIGNGEDNSYDTNSIIAYGYLDLDTSMSSIENSISIGFYSGYTYNTNMSLSAISLYVGRGDCQDFIDHTSIENTNIKLQQNVVGIPINSKLFSVLYPRNLFQQGGKSLSTTFYVLGNQCKSGDEFLFYLTPNRSVKNLGTIFRSEGLIIDNSEQLTLRSTILIRNGKNKAMNGIAIINSNILDFSILLYAKVIGSEGYVQDFYYQKNINTLTTTIKYFSYDANSGKLIAIGGSLVESELIVGMYVLRMAAHTTDNYALGKIKSVLKIESMTPSEDYGSYYYEIMLDVSSSDLSSLVDFDDPSLSNCPIMIFDKSVHVDLSSMISEINQLSGYTFSHIDSVSIIIDYGMTNLRESLFNLECLSESLYSIFAGTLQRMNDIVQIGNILPTRKFKFNSKISGDSSQSFEISNSSLETESGGLVSRSYPAILRKFSINIGQLTSREISEIISITNYSRLRNEFVISNSQNRLFAIPATISSPASVSTYTGLLDGIGSAMYDASIEFSEVGYFDRIEVVDEEE